MPFYTLYLITETAEALQIRYFSGQYSVMHYDVTLRLKLDAAMHDISMMHDSLECCNHSRMRMVPTLCLVADCHRA